MRLPDASKLFPVPSKTRFNEMNISPKPDTKAEDDFMNASGGYSGSATNAPEPQSRNEGADPAAAPSTEQAEAAPGSGGSGSAWNFPEKEPTVRLSVFLPISICMAIKAEAKSRKVPPQIIVEEMTRKCLSRWIQRNS